MRDDFSSKVINTLSRRAGFHCSNPYCRKLTVGANENKDKSTLLGVAAHITAASVGGPRYDPSITPELRSSLDNAIWLCVNCSTLIDKDTSKYTVETLKEWKEKIENESSNELQKNNSESKIGKPLKPIEEAPSFQQQAERIKEQRRKKHEIESFLKSREAISAAKNQVGIIISKLKECKQALEDPEAGFYLGETSRRDEMYGIGYKDIYLCFNWCRPQECDVNYAMLKVSVFRMAGHHGINYTETPIILKDYRYTRNIDGKDGWIDFQTGEHFISTQQLIDAWTQEFLRLAKLEGH